MTTIRDAALPLEFLISDEILWNIICYATTGNLNLCSTLCKEERLCNSSSIFQSVIEAKTVRLKEECLNLQAPVMASVKQEAMSRTTDFRPPGLWSAHCLERERRSAKLNKQTDRAVLCMPRQAWNKALHKVLLLVCLYRYYVVKQVDYGWARRRGVCCRNCLGSPFHETLLGFWTPRLSYILFTDLHRMCARSCLFCGNCKQI